MKRASDHFTAEQRRRIEQAITQAEQKTAAEIVVVVATRSGRYDRAEDVFGLLLALIAVAAAWVLFQGLQPSSAPWIAGHELTLGLLPVLLLFALWWLVGVALASRFPALARPFASRGRFEAEVRRRGFEAFYLCRVSNTRQRHGVLVFVSLFEHMALISGDEAINAAIPSETWSAATRAIADAAKRGEHEQGIIRAVELVGEALAPRFPKDPADQDELPNVVHFLD
jgi:putative membrane protein